MALQIKYKVTDIMSNSQEDCYSAK